MPRHDKTADRIINRDLKSIEDFKKSISQMDKFRDIVGKVE